MATELQSGMLVGRYRLDRRLAEGGMGSVWAARDERLERTVAIKVLPRLLVTDPSAHRRFEREARAMGRLSHPNVATVFDVGTADPGTGEELPYLVMELIAGSSLTDLVREGPLAPRRAAAIMAQVARALAAAHDAGVIHRDLKPSNIMISAADHVKVLDFGLARLGDAGDRPREETLTTPGMVLGSCPYMSPEQALGQTVSARSDLFSVGSVLFEALSGRRAFDGTTPMRVLQAVVRCEYRSLDEIGAEVPPELVAVVERCLSKDPARRYPDAHELARDLESCAAGGTATEPDHPTVRLPSESVRALTLRRRRDRARGAAWILAAALVAAAATWNAARWRQEPLRPDPGRWTAREIVRFDGTARHPAWTPDGRSVLYDRSTPGRSEIAVVDVDGGTTRVVGRAPSGSAWSGPRVSPDGRAVLVRAVEGEVSGLRVLPITGGEPVARIGDTRAADWIEPSVVLFARESESGPELWRWRVDTGEATYQRALGVASGAWDMRRRSDGTLALATGAVESRPDLVVTDVVRDRLLVLLRSRSVFGFHWMPGRGSLVASVDGRLVRVVGEGEVHQLLPSIERLWDPALSPDGRRLAVVSQRSTNDLIAVDLDGEGFTCLLCDVPDTGWGAVGPDGTIAFRRTVAGRSKLYLARPDGSIEPLPTAPGDASCPSFSPRGDRLAYLVRDDGRTALAVSSVTGGATVILADDVEPSEYPSWSPDGRRIAFAAGDPLTVQVVSAAGGAPVDLTPAGGDYPVWSPDGDWIAYSVWTEDADPDQGAWVIPADGSSSPLQVGRSPTRLVWSPDGRWLRQLRRSDEELELWEAETGRWQWRRRARLEVGDGPRFHLEHLPLTTEPGSGRLVVNRRNNESSILLFDGLEPERW